MIDGIEFEGLEYYWFMPTFNESTGQVGGRVDFVYDAENETFIMYQADKVSGGHTGLARAIGVSDDAAVGGRIMFTDEGMITSEWSGHYGKNWTPEIRKSFSKFMEKYTKTHIHKAGDVKLESNGSR